MKKISTKDLSLAEVRVRLEEERKQLQKLKFNHAVSPLENPMKIKTSRRNVARLMTEIAIRTSKELKA